MCWNWKVSIITWLIGFITALFLFYRRNKFDVTFGALILVYSSMQLWEAMMWLDQKCGTVNKVATIGAYFALWSHVLAIGVGLFIELKILSPLIIGIVFLLVGFVRSFCIKWKCSKPGSKKCDTCHLVWGFPPSFYMYVFAMCIAMSLMYIRPMSKALVACSLFVVSFILCLIYAKHAVGSFWCWVAAFAAPIFILVNR